MEHRTVRRTATAKMMPLHEAGKTATLAGSDDVHYFAIREDVDQDLISGIRRFATRHASLAQNANRRRVVTGLGEMTRLRFVYPLRFDEFDEAELDGVISVLGHGLLLHHDAGTGLNNGDWNNAPIVLEQLRHSDFFAN